LTALEFAKATVNPTMHRSLVNVAHYHQLPRFKVLPFVGLTQFISTFYRGQPLKNAQPPFQMELIRLHQRFALTA